MNIKTLIRQATAVTVASAAMCLSPVAQSVVLKPTGYYVPPAEQFGLTIGGSPHAGAFVGTADGAPVIFWCAELTEFFSFGNTYNYTETLPNDATFTMLGELFTDNYAHFLANATPQYSAAFQLAIWEILYDPDLLLNQGAFQTTSGSAATILLAQQLLDTVNGGPDLYNIFLWSNQGAQNFIVPGAPPRITLVPEPAPLLLIGAALMAMLIFLKRRRSQKATS